MHDIRDGRTAKICEPSNLTRVVVDRRRKATGCMRRGMSELQRMRPGRGAFAYRTDTEGGGQQHLTSHSHHLTERRRGADRKCHV